MKYLKLLWVLIVFLIVYTLFINFTIGTISLLLLVSALVILSFYIYYKREHLIYKDLEDLSNLTQAYIDDKDHVEANILRDDLVSKIQNQVVKIWDLLELQHAKEKDERKRLESLIGDISHQLKTPLTNLKMYYELMGTEATSNEMTLAMNKQINKLEWLVESLVSLSKIESGCIDLRLVEANISQTLQNTIGQIYLKAQKKSMDINFDYKDIKVKHDLKWTSEAIYNVLDNAVKYSPEHSKIIVELLENDMFVKIKVIDEGIGINDQEMNDLFKRFYRSPQVHDYEGIGIGLYLSQKILNEQGGYIYASSNGKGTTFEINLRQNI